MGTAGVSMAVTQRKKRVLREEVAGDEEEDSAGESGKGDGEEPCPDYFGTDAPAHCRETLKRADSHNCTCDCLCSTDRNTERSCTEQRDGAGELCTEAADGAELRNPHTHSFYNPPPAECCAESNCRVAGQ